MIEEKNCTHNHHICRDCGRSVPKPTTITTSARFFEWLHHQDGPLVLIGVGFFLFMMTMIIVLGVFGDKTPAIQQMRMDHEIRVLELQAKICEEHRKPELEGKR